MGLRLMGQTAMRDRLSVQAREPMATWLVCILLLTPQVSRSDELDFPPLQRQPLSDRLNADEPRTPGASDRPLLLPRESGRSDDLFDFPPLERSQDGQDGTGTRQPLPPLPAGNAGAALPEDRGPEISDFADWPNIGDGDEFDWTTQTVTPADLAVGAIWPFLHGQPGLVEHEQIAYGDLVRLALARRSLIPAGLSESANADSIWQSTFYRYAQVRRQAWQEGNLKLGRTAPVLADPFARTDEITMVPSAGSGGSLRTGYSLQQDMRVHPEDFVGRPVFLYGLFAPSGSVTLPVSSPLEGEPSEYVVQRGSLTPLSGGAAIALVDAISFSEPGLERPSTAWPLDERVQIPVLVKGWFVKQWGGTPLVFAETLQTISAQPYRQQITRQVRNRSRVTGDESWLYYETLRQLQVTKADAQRELADQELGRRLQVLRGEVAARAKQRSAELSKELKRADTAGDDNRKATLQQQLLQLERQLALRESRYRSWMQEPQKFPKFVDVFRNPDYWQGRLLTCSGYVRRILRHEGDEAFFSGQPLYELWLYTEDGQHIPTVVVTPELPNDFPVGAEIVNSVQVTGCLFKMYVYRSQQDARLAPLLLAGRIQWSPDPGHVNELVRAGHIPADATIARKAQEAESGRVSDTLVMLFSGLVLLGAITVWGRVQRDRRERKRLLRLVDDLPDFAHTSDSIA